MLTMISRLDQRDPPGLVRRHAVTASSAFATSTMPPRPSACSSATRAMPVAQAAVDACRQRDRAAVRADRDEVAGRDLAPPCVVGRELELGLRPLELELGDALDGGAGEERLVGDESDLAALRLLLRRRAGPELRRAPALRGSRAAAPARRPRRTRVRRRRAPRPRRRRRAAYGATSTSNRAASCEIHSSSSGQGGSTVRREPLQPALEVDERAVALEVARARQDQVGPAGGEPAEHRDHDRRLGLLGERADVLVRRGLVARDHEQPDRIRRLGLLVAARGPGVGDPAAVRRLGQVEGAAAFAAGEAELLRELRDGRSAAAAGTAPDEDDALRVGDVGRPSRGSGRRCGAPT